MLLRRTEKRDSRVARSPAVVLGIWVGSKWRRGQASGRGPVHIMVLSKAALIVLMLVGLLGDRSSRTRGSEGLR